VRIRDLSDGVFARTQIDQTHSPMCRSLLRTLRGSLTRHNSSSRHAGHTRHDCCTHHYSRSYHGCCTHHDGRSRYYSHSRHGCRTRHNHTRHSWGGMFPSRASQAARSPVQVWTDGPSLAPEPKSTFHRRWPPPMPPRANAAPEKIRAELRITIFRVFMFSILFRR
jgi:hypothetical protein